MKLDCLTGSKMDTADLVLLNRLCCKSKLFLCDSSGSHPETEHSLFSVFLCIASVQTGKAFVVFFCYFAVIKCYGFFSESGHILFPGLRIDFVIHSCTSV